MKLLREALVQIETTPAGEFLTAPKKFKPKGKEKGKDVEWTFTVNDKTQIKKGGKPAVTNDLVVGDGVNVRYIDQGGKSVASAINVRSKPAVAK